MGAPARRRDKLERRGAGEAGDPAEHRLVRPPRPPEHVAIDSPMATATRGGHPEEDHAQEGGHGEEELGPSHAVEPGGSGDVGQ